MTQEETAVKPDIMILIVDVTKGDETLCDVTQA